MNKKKDMSLTEFLDLFKVILGEKQREKREENELSLEPDEEYVNTNSIEGRTRFLFSKIIVAEGKKPGGYFDTKKDSSFQNYHDGEHMTEFLKKMFQYFERSEFSAFVSELNDEQTEYLKEKLLPHRPNLQANSSYEEVADETAALFMEILTKKHDSIMKEKSEKKKASTNVKLKTDFSRGRDDPNKFFMLREYYIPPTEALTRLQTSAFTLSNVHVLTGQRGIGKTLLAQYFARSCCMGGSTRKELHYNTVIKVTASDQGLRDTIMQIPRVGMIRPDWRYDEQIKLLKKVKKPCLLIIDNYDDEANYAKELSADCTDYLDLLSTGCHILFTSKVDLEDCHEVQQTQVRPLSEENQFRLFCKLAENIDPEKDREKIRRLIGQCLMGNTYLIVLAAELMESRSLDDVIESFSSLSVGEIDDPISTNKDGKKQRDASLMEHFKIMFDLAGICSDSRKLRLLYNLALLPLEGMPYDMFFEEAFLTEERKDMLAAFKQLRDGFWVVIENRRVSLHPMVRELVLTELPSQEFDTVAQLVRSITEMLHVELYADDTVPNLNYGVSAYDACKKRDFRTFETALLVSQISSNYDILKSKEHAYSYGVKALDELKDYVDTTDVSRQLFLADCYNVVGYAILHAVSKPDFNTLAKRAFHEASNFASKCLKDPQYKYQAQLLKTKIRGNIAGWHLTKKEYAEALAIHAKERDFRIKLVKKDPSAQNQCALASSYKGMATAYFYLSRQTTGDASIENLRSSLQNHYEAAMIYEAVLTKKNLETVTENNRLVGTGASLLKALGTSADPEYVRGKIEDFLIRMESAALYLGTIPPVDAEIKDCICHTASLAGIMNDLQIKDRKLWKKATHIADTISKLDFGKKWDAPIQAIYGSYKESPCVHRIPNMPT